jgi:hypothetical protein
VSADVVGNAYSLLSRRTADWSLDQPFYVDQEFFDLYPVSAAWPCRLHEHGVEVSLDLWTLIHRYIQEGSPVQKRSQSDL